MSSSPLDETLMPDTEQSVQKAWQAHGLDRLPTALRLDATITARTLGLKQAKTKTWDVRSLPKVEFARGADIEPRDLLGEGGMGRVLLAHQHSLQRDVAVKILKADVESDQVATSLMIEAVVMGSLEHPNIVPVHALGHDEHGHPLFLMKRIEGVSWRDLLRDPHHPAWQHWETPNSDRLVASVEILMTVCHAVQFAHTRGVIHRDIKPENVMLGAFGEVYLVDWGIAVREHTAGMDGLLGTPAYMAPEMLEGSPASVTPKTDVYLLGATLHEVLTGQARHERASLYQALLSVYESAPLVYPDTVPSELAALANQACARAPEDRVASAEMFRQRPAAWLQHRGSTELAQQTQLRATSLPELAQLAKSGKASDRATFDKHAMECRFGYLEALRQWPENLVANEGLRDVLRQIVELEHENIQGVHSLLDELKPVPPDLQDKLEQVTANIQQRHQEAAAGRAVMADLDEGVSLFERTVFLSLLGVVLTVIGLYLNFGLAGRSLTVAQSLRFAMISTTVLTLAALVLRRQLVANTVNKRFAALMMISLYTILAHRALVYWRGGTDVAAMLTDDLMITIGTSAIAAVVVKPVLAVLTAVLAATALAIHLAPHHAAGFFFIAPFSTVSCALWIFFQERQRQKRNAQHSPHSLRSPHADTTR